MNREIKFRAWIKRRRKMLEWEELEGVANGIGWLNTTKCKVMQYTGLKDKNNKEIYEGDVIMISPFKKDKGCLYEIVYVEPGARYDGISLLSGIGEHLSILSVNCEVIGNIYENEELLYLKTKDLNS